MSQDNDVPSVGRALAVMSAVANASRPIGLSELASSLGIPRSTTHGLCHTLTRHGYLCRDASSTYSIGPAVMGLAHAFLRHASVAAEFGTLWAQIAPPPLETMAITLLSGSSVLYVAVREGARPLGMEIREGMQFPAHLTASGRAILAWRPPSEVRDLIDRAHRSRAMGPVSEIMAELDVVRQRGWAKGGEAIRRGVACFGAPVFDSLGGVVAGLAVCVHTAFQPTEEHGQMALGLASELSRRLGGPSPYGQGGNWSAAARPA